MHYAIAIIFAAAAITGGFANSLVVSRTIEGISRQPEARSSLMGVMLLGLGLVEAIPVIAVAAGFILTGKL